MHIYPDGKGAGLNAIRVFLQDENDGIAFFLHLLLLLTALDSIIGTLQKQMNGSASKKCSG